MTPNIKWWRQNEENLKMQFREKVLDERRLLESYRPRRNGNIRKAGRENTEATKEVA